MNAEDLKKRTKLFALRILKLAAALPNTVEGEQLEGNWYVQAHRWVQAIARLAEDARGRNL